MALSKEIYRQFEDIVGADNISDDPALLDSYRYPLSHTAIHIGPYYRVYTPRGAAVLLPGSTPEVQTIVRLCNKHRIKFKPSSTFWSAWGYPLRGRYHPAGHATDGPHPGDQTRRTVRRRRAARHRGAIAGRGHEGGAEHPHARARLELLLPGQRHLLGEGWDRTAFIWATITRTCSAWNGSCPTASSWRWGRPVPAWAGSAATGPGPSLKGIVRGMVGTNGAMGVFTKVALKLYPWPGPATLPVEGRPPAYKAALPDNIRGYTLGFPTWKAWADSCYMVWDAGIGYVAHRQYSMFGRDLKGAMVRILSDPTKTLSDIQELLNDPEVRKMNKDMERDYQIVLAGMTPRDIEWQDRALDKILEETGGWKVQGMLEPDLL